MQKNDKHWQQRNDKKLNFLENFFIKTNRKVFRF